MVLGLQQAVHGVCDRERVIPVVVRHFPVVLLHGECEAQKMANVKSLKSKEVFEHEDNIQRFFLIFDRPRREVKSWNVLDLEVCSQSELVFEKCTADQSMY